MTTYAYPPEFVDALASFGLAPGPGTPPSFVRDALSELYKYELRRLRGQLLAGDFERSRYLELIVVLRKKYWLLTLPLGAWERICQGQRAEGKGQR